MTNHLLVVGTGKMARDVGSFFLRWGHAVTWCSAESSRLAELEQWVRRRSRRWAPLGDGAAGLLQEPAAHFLLLGEGRLPTVDLVLECTREDLETKREALRRLQGAVDAEALWATCSSSLCPQDVHPQGVGLHFFYPLEMTNFLELVLPDACPTAVRKRVHAFLHGHGLVWMEQSPSTAFAVNRLLLPLQNECFIALRGGWAPEWVELCSASALIPQGQLSLMDSIGLDVVSPAVGNYLARMEPAVAAPYQPLRQGLAELLAAGKRGNKNRDGLLRGRTLPWPRREVPTERESTQLALLWSCLLVNTCRHALASRLLQSGELEHVLSLLFGWNHPLERALPLPTDEARQLLLEAWQRTRRPYFLPASWTPLAGPSEQDWRQVPALI